MKSYWFARRLFEGFDHLKDRVALSGAKVVDLQAWIIGNLLQRSAVSSCQVKDVDVVSHACTVRGLVVFAEDFHFGMLANSYLADIRHEIVGWTSGIFANQTALVRADWIEVAENDDVPALQNGGSRVNVKAGGWRFYTRQVLTLSDL